MVRIASRMKLTPSSSGTNKQGRMPDGLIQSQMLICDVTILTGKYTSLK